MVEQFLKSDPKIIETRGKIDSLNTYKPDHPLSYLSTGISIKCDAVKQVIWS